EDGTETFPVGNLSTEEIKRAVNTTVGLAFANVIPVDEMIARLGAAKGAAAAAE
ncbi:MAG: hypothetical protein H8E30_02080, partial [Alphaproteobacteria bacterium]|nr:hypothetical protein [Alphaproteobacteria bacterium]